MVRRVGHSGGRRRTGSRTRSARPAEDSAEHHSPPKTLDSLEVTLKHLKNASVEIRSLKDAREKLRENRAKLLSEMGIARDSDELSDVSRHAPSECEVVRETVIEHNIQIPHTRKVMKEVMKSISYEDIEWVSEEEVHTEIIPQRVVVVKEEEPQLLSNAGTFNNSIELAKRAWDHHLPQSQSSGLKADNNVQQIPNESFEERHIVEDKILEVDHVQPVPFEQRSHLNYRCPKLQPVYRDEYYTLNVPRIIQVPIYEEFLPEANLNTLLIMRDRFDEMCTMKEPISMKFVEDYADVANRLYTVPPGLLATPMVMVEPSQVTPETSPRTTGQAVCTTSSRDSIHTMTQSADTSTKMRSLSFATNTTQTSKASNLRVAGGCCSPIPAKSETDGSKKPKKKVYRKKEKLNKSDRKKNFTAAPISVTVPYASTLEGATMSNEESRKTSYAQESYITSPETEITGLTSTSHTITVPGQLGRKQIITETFEGDEIEKRSVDTDYVQQFVTNADPLGRHPPAVIGHRETFDAASFQTAGYSDTASVVVEPLLQSPIKVPVASMDHESKSFDGLSLPPLNIPSIPFYQDRAAHRSPFLPRLDQDGNTLIRPPESSRVLMQTN